jgi:hypothetical protein
MRKSFDGLFGIIIDDLSRDVRDGGLFMFLNSRRNRIKILYWDTDIADDGPSNALLHGWVTLEDCSFDMNSMSQCMMLSCTLRVL